MKQFILSAVVIAASLGVHAQMAAPANSFFEDFNDSNLKYFRFGSTGNASPEKWRHGINAATDPSVNIISLRLDPTDSAGAGRGPEIISNKLTHFGTYSSRLKVPAAKAVQPNVGAVVGYFTYHVDSIIGLSEIDFEWLIADPTIIYIGTWTGHHGKLQRIGRTINLAKGIIYNTVYKENHNGEPTVLTGAQNQPEKIPAIAGYDASSKFYTYGFDWKSDRLTWWIIHPETGEKIILWDYQGSKLGIPQNASRYRMNFWHTNEWSVHTNPASVERPVKSYELEVDWMKYDAAE
jgi:hypothetical protein